MTNALPGIIIKTKSEPRARLLLRFGLLYEVVFTNHESFRHFAGVAVAFFLRLYTMIVTVYSPMWNVKRMPSPPFGDVGATARACVRPSALAGVFYCTGRLLACQGCHDFVFISQQSGVKSHNSFGWIYHTSQMAVL